MKDSFVEQVVFDLRKQSVKDSPHEYTFKKELDIWKNKPTIVT